MCRWKKQAVRIVVLVAALGTIALSGQKIYSKATFTEAENEYKLPQAALDVADILAGAGVNWKVRSVVPNELLCYIRQYRCYFMEETWADLFPGSGMMKSQCISRCVRKNRT